MISIIICCNDQKQFDTFCYPTLYRASQILKSDGLDPLDIVLISENSSIFKGYNRGIDNSKYKIKVFMHQDVNLLNPNWVFKVLTAFAENPEYGLLGLAGTTKLPKTGFWWEEGKEYLVGELFSGKERADWVFRKIDCLTEAECVDSYFMCTNRNVRFDENCKGFHLVDIDYSKTFLSLGYKIGVIPHKAWHIGTIRNQDTSEYIKAHYDKWGPWAPKNI